MLYDDVRQLTMEYSSEMFKFLREVIAIKSYDGGEKDVINRIYNEYKKIGFDEIHCDVFGNLIGRIGSGSHSIAFDGHCDTVESGDLSLWSFDPFAGIEDDVRIGGLGSADQKGGIAAFLYAIKIIKELDIFNDITIYAVTSIQEENCDGLCWQHLIEKENIRPDFCVLTEPCDQKIRNGQKGRMEIHITTQGVSSHGSLPEKGINAVYKMAPIIAAIENLNKQLKDDGVLGKGTVTISSIISQAPSLCAVADRCTIILDRRLNSLETPQIALEQLRNLPEIQNAFASVESGIMEGITYTKHRYHAPATFPSWILQEEHVACQSITHICQTLFQEKISIEPWPCSTNGTSIMGMYHIPCVGYGAGELSKAHKPNEEIKKKDLLRACAVYALLPQMYSLLKRT